MASPHSSEPDLLERQKSLITLHNGAPICRTFGMTLSYDDAGQASIALPYNPSIDHGLHGIHGGVIASLIDNAGWFTVAPHFSCWIATVEFQTRILEHAEKTTLISQGRLVRLGKKISVAEMTVSTLEGKKIAVGSGTFAVTSVPLNGAHHLTDPIS